MSTFMRKKAYVKEEILTTRAAAMEPAVFERSEVSVAWHILARVCQKCGGEACSSELG